MKLVALAHMAPKVAGAAAKILQCRALTEELDSG